MHGLDQLVDVLLEEILGARGGEAPRRLVRHAHAHVHADGRLHGAGDGEAERRRDGALERRLGGADPQVLDAAGGAAHAAHGADVGHGDGGGGAVAGHGGDAAAVAGERERVDEAGDGVGVVAGALVLRRRHHAAHLLAEALRDGRHGGGGRGAGGHVRVGPVAAGVVGVAVYADAVLEFSHGAVSGILNPGHNLLY